jgi:hypothetical protein
MHFDEIRFLYADVLVNYNFKAPTSVLGVIKLFGVILLTLFCKLDLFITMPQIFFIKWSSLQKA